jgi:Ca2+-binding EF-hand superfamily protein
MVVGAARRSPLEELSPSYASPGQPGSPTRAPGSAHTLEQPENVTPVFLPYAKRQRPFLKPLDKDTVALAALAGSPSSTAAPVSGRSADRVRTDTMETLTEDGAADDDEQLEEVVPEVEVEEVMSLPVQRAPIDEAGEEDGNVQEFVSSVKFAPTLDQVLLRYDGKYSVDRDCLQLAFERFSNDEGSSIPISRLNELLIHLGFMTCTESQVTELAVESTYSIDFDIADAAEFVYAFCQCERRTLRHTVEVYAKLVAEGSGGGMEGLRQFLFSAGQVLSDEQMESALQMACPGVAVEHQNFQQLLRFVAACRVNEGFTPDEVSDAQEVFDELEADDSPGGMATRKVKVSELAAGLTSFFSLYCLRHLEEMGVLSSTLSGKEEKVKYDRGLSMYEFLIWLRRLRDLDMIELLGCFQKVDKSGLGNISADSAIRMLRGMGFTLLLEQAHELLEDVGIKPKDRISFGTAVSLVKACRQKHGFTRKEVEDYTNSFCKFDEKDDGELTTGEVVELLRYLGFSLDVEQVKAMIEQVDFNKNGTMDIGEFLVLMRMVREKDIAGLLDAFNQSSDHKRELEASMVEATLCHVLEQDPPQSVLDQVLQDIPLMVNFNTFCSLVDTCRQCTTAESRLRAGFPEDEFAKLTQLFEDNCSSDPLWISVSSLIHMLMDTHLDVNTACGRQDLFNRLEAARSAALEAGMQETDPPQGAGDQHLSLFTFVHLVRGIVRDLEAKSMDREANVMDVTKFTVEEAAEFRKVFMEFHSKIKQGDDKGSRRRSSMTQGQLQGLQAAGRDSGRISSKRTPSKKLEGAPRRERLSTVAVLKELTEAPTIPEKDLTTLLQNLGLKVTSRQMSMLGNKIADTKMRAEEVDGVDFPSFLLIARWMLDSNFGGVAC